MLSVLHGVGVRKFGSGQGGWHGHQPKRRVEPTLAAGEACQRPPTSCGWACGGDESLVGDGRRQGSRSRSWRAHRRARRSYGGGREEGPATDAFTDGVVGGGRCTTEDVRMVATRRGRTEGGSRRRAAAELGDHFTFLAPPWLRMSTPSYLWVVLFMDCLWPCAGCRRAARELGSSWRYTYRLSLRAGATGLDR